MTEMFERQANLGRDSAGFEGECERYTHKTPPVDPASCHMLVSTSHSFQHSSCTSAPTVIMRVVDVWLKCLENDKVI